MRKGFYPAVRCCAVAALGLLCCPSASGVSLVRYGSSSGSNTYGLAGWNTVIKSGNLGYTSQGNGGLMLSSSTSEYGDYRGVRGTARKFSAGERIVVTWYNLSEETFYFTARVSFTDDNNPSESSTTKKWYTMRSFADYRFTYTRIEPHTTARTVFNITDAGVHKTDETYSLVNINTAIEWGSTTEKEYLICQEIELLSDADTAPPDCPAGLTATTLSDSKIRLDWTAPADNVGTVEYLIWNGGSVEGYSRSASHTCVLLEPDTEYTFSVTALDAAGNESAASDPVSASTDNYSGSSSLLDPAALEYLGVFAIPEEYNWGGESMAVNPDGDGGQTGSGSLDGFPGSIYVTNVNQPENGLTGEVSIPQPAIPADRNVENLNQSLQIRSAVNIRPSNVNSWDFVDIWRMGLEHVAAENRLYGVWNYHYTVTGEKHASISCCSASNLSGGTKYGAWYLGNASLPPIDAMMGDWLFSIPQSWADDHCSGRNLVTGRCRDGGLSGLGPTLYAFSRVGTTPPSANHELNFTTLLKYGPVEGTDNYNYPNSMDGYKHSDDWREAVWLYAESRNAVAIFGNKALGDNWYGYHGERMHHDWVIADVPHPDFSSTDPDGKGWRGHENQPMIIFFDPADLAKVAAGTMKSFEPQPYAALRLDKDLFFGAAQEIYSGEFDPLNGILYVIERVLEADMRLLVHAWRVHADPTSAPPDKSTPRKLSLEQNFPNPFNPRTRIRYSVPHETHVRIAVYNLRGEEMEILVHERKPAGTHTIEFDGTGLSSGIYLCRLTAGSHTETRKWILVR